MEADWLTLMPLLQTVSAMHAFTCGKQWSTRHCVTFFCSKLIAWSSTVGGASAAVARGSHENMIER